MGKRISFALLNDANDRRFYPIFTNAEELMKWQLAREESSSTMALAFDNYAQMIVEKNAADGIAVNPFGDNLLVTGLFRTHKRQKTGIHNNFLCYLIHYRRKFIFVCTLVPLCEKLLQPNVFHFCNRKRYR